MVKVPGSVAVPTVVVDGSSLTGYGSGEVDWSTAARYSIGQQWDGDTPSQFWNGDIPEVIVYKNTLKYGTANDCGELLECQV